jgi:putative transposase
MKLEEGNLYHVFNRGNNKQKIFLEQENYSYFLNGIEKYLVPDCDILAWCLMPNHFHFLIYANQNSVIEITDGSFKRQRFSQGIKQLLSSYTKAVNKKYGRTGSLFQQKTKALCVLDGERNYAATAFHYIHQNPLKSGLVKMMEDWTFSSFQDYCATRDWKLCNFALASRYLEINPETFYRDSYKAMERGQEQVSYTPE